MHSLLLKDALILRRFLLAALVYIAFIAFTMPYGFGPFLVPGMTVSVTWILISQSINIDYKDDAELVLLSLPLLRKEIVQAKYLTLFIYALLCFICFQAAQWIYALFVLGHLSMFSLPWVSFAVTLLVVSLMGSIFYPFYFKFGSQVKNIMIAVFLAPVLFLALLRQLGQSSLLKTLAGSFHWISLLSDSALFVSALLLAALFSVASYFLSLKFYEKREF